MRSADTSSINFQYKGTKPQLTKAISPIRTPEVARDEAEACTLDSPPGNAADANHRTKIPPHQPAER